MSAPLVHVGLHRTGTTWLQDGLFTEAAGVFSPALSIAEAVDLLVRPHDLEWSGESAASARSAIAAGVEAARRADRLPVISCEELSGNPHAGAWNSASLAERLHEVVPDARILIVVRRQADLVLSNHRQYLARGGVGSLRRYLYPDPRWFRVPRFRFGTFEFDRLAMRYRELFGPDRVSICCHEGIADAKAHARAIVRLAGGDPARLRVDRLPRQAANAAPSALLCAILRRSNRLIRRDDVNPHAPCHQWRLHRALLGLDRILLRRLAGGLDRRERRMVEEACRGRYAESNARLAELIGSETAADLVRFAYELPTSSPSVDAATGRSR